MERIVINSNKSYWWGCFHDLYASWNPGTSRKFRKPCPHLFGLGKIMISLLFFDENSHWVNWPLFNRLYLESFRNGTIKKYGNQLWLPESGTELYQVDGIFLKLNAHAIQLFESIESNLTFSYWNCFCLCFFWHFY